MATLLDGFVRSRGLMDFLQGRQAGRGGLLPSQDEVQEERPRPAMQRPARGGGGGNVLTRIFAGPNDPSVSPEANAAARRQALIQAGLATIASQGQGLQKVAQGALTGQQAAQGLRQNALRGRRLELAERGLNIDEARFAQEVQSAQAARSAEQERAQRMMDVFGGEDGKINKGQVDAALSASLQAGDFEAAKELRQLRTQFDEGTGPVLKSVSRNGVTLTARVQDDGTLVDAVTGEELSEDMFQKLPEPRDPEEVQDRIQTLNRAATSDLQDAVDVATAVRIGTAVPNTAPGATTLFTMLTRAIDPGVSVREADIARGEAATTLRGRALNVYNKWLEEGQLNQTQFDLLQDELRRIGRQQQEQMSALRRFWERRAQNARVDPDLVVPPDPFEGVLGEEDEDEEEDQVASDPVSGIRNFRLDN